MELIFSVECEPTWRQCENFNLNCSLTVITKGELDIGT